MCDSVFNSKVQDYFIDVKGHLSSTKIRLVSKKDIGLYKAILEKTKFLDKIKPTFTQRIKTILNGHTSMPMCVCGQPLKYLTHKRDYSTHCEAKCSYYYRDLQNKLKKTCMKKYKASNYFGSVEGKKKVKTRMTELYGEDHPSKVSSIVKKREQTCLKKFGANSPLGNLKIREKICNTNLKKYGVENPSSSPVIKKIREKTLQDRYGVTNIFQSENIKKRICKKHDAFTRKHLKKDVQLLLGDPIKLKQQLIRWNHDEKKTLVEIASILGITDSNVGKWFKRLKITLYKHTSSMLEKDIFEYCQSIYSGEILNRHKVNGVEVDIFFPKENFGIEVHGVFWHSFNDVVKEKKEKFKHQVKYIQCKSNNVRLFQIFENEWTNSIKKEIWKSIIRGELARHGQSIFIRVYARVCEIREINFLEAKEFLNKNHIQGSIPASKYIALFKDNSIVLLMCLGKPRFSKHTEWEIYRLCSLTGVVVIGGASRLFKYFTRQYNPSSVITYCDLRYGTGKVYEKLQFEKGKITSPNYFYIDFNIKTKELYSRYKFQKHKLSKILDNFDANLSEAENMFNNGYRRIWDAGNLVYEYKQVI